MDSGSEPEGPAAELGSACPGKGSVGVGLPFPEAILYWSRRSFDERLGDATGTGELSADSCFATASRSSVSMGSVSKLEGSGRRPPHVPALSLLGTCVNFQFMDGNLQMDPNQKQLHV